MIIEVNSASRGKINYVNLEFHDGGITPDRFELNEDEASDLSVKLMKAANELRNLDRESSFKKGVHPDIDPEFVEWVKSRLPLYHNNQLATSIQVEMGDGVFAGAIWVDRFELLSNEMRFHSTKYSPLISVKCKLSRAGLPLMSAKRKEDGSWDVITRGTQDFLNKSEPTVGVDFEEVCRNKLVDDVWKWIFPRIHRNVLLSKNGERFYSPGRRWCFQIDKPFFHKRSRETIFTIIGSPIVNGRAKVVDGGSTVVVHKTGEEVGQEEILSRIITSFGQAWNIAFRETHEEA